MDSLEKVVGAVDIGGTKIAVGLVNAAGQILEQDVFPSEPERGFADGLARMRDHLFGCMNRRPEIDIQGIGIGATGPVDPETGVLGPNSFLPDWEGESLIAHFERLFGLPAAIENDADAAALGEFAWGAGRGSKRFLYVTVSTGIGCGVVIDGRLYRGAGGAHPEMGHHVIDASGPQCFCGARGCWEILAAGPAMASWYNARQPEGSPPLDARQIAARAVQGDPLTLEAVEREGRYLGIGLANLVTLFVPDVIALGGGMMGSWHLFKTQVRETIRKSCGLVPYENTQLRLASLGAQTGLAGAAQVWFHRFSG